MRFKNKAEFKRHRERLLNEGGQDIIDVYNWHKKLFNLILKPSVISLSTINVLLFAFEPNLLSVILPIMLIITYFVYKKTSEDEVKHEKKIISKRYKENNGQIKKVHDILKNRKYSLQTKMSKLNIYRHISNFKSFLNLLITIILMYSILFLYWFLIFSIFYIFQNISIISMFIILSSSISMFIAVYPINIVLFKISINTTFKSSIENYHILDSICEFNKKESLLEKDSLTIHENYLGKIKSSKQITEILHYNMKIYSNFTKAICSNKTQNMFLNEITKALFNRNLAKLSTIFEDQKAKVSKNKSYTSRYYIVFKKNPLPAKFMDDFYRKFPLTKIDYLLIRTEILNNFIIKNKPALIVISALILFILSFTNPNIINAIIKIKNIFF